MRPYDEKAKEHKTPEEKQRILESSIEFFRHFVTNGRQGNVTFSCFNKIVGKTRVEVYVEPLEFRKVFNMEDKNESAQ